MKKAQTGHSLEGISFELLRTMQRSLTGALNALGGKWGNGLFEHYLFYSSAQINRAGEGYIALRDAGRVDASKLLVRPAIELMIRQQAVLKQPDLLFRMAYTERLEDRKWLSPVWKRAGKDYAFEDQQQWQEFSRRYAQQYPKHHREEKKLTLLDAAKVANLDGYYDSHYRMYCQFTHGAFRAMVGILKFSDLEDNRTMAACMLSALDALNKGAGADVRELAELRQRLIDLPDHLPKQRQSPR